jgi:hypothetical protein
LLFGFCTFGAFMRYLCSFYVCEFLFITSLAARQISLPTCRRLLLVLLRLRTHSLPHAMGRWSPVLSTIWLVRIYRYVPRARYRHTFEGHFYTSSWYCLPACVRERRDVKRRPRITANHFSEDDLMREFYFCSIVPCAWVAARC